MDEITLKALAKINLGLDVVRRREDGYHEVRMIMQTIHLYDLLEIQKIREPEIQIVSNLSFLPVNENNLVYKAARLLQEEFALTDGISVKLTKRIPVAAGMAGGSTDAAAMLYAMNQLYDLGLSRRELMKRGVQIGGRCSLLSYAWNGTSRRNRGKTDTASADDQMSGADCKTIHFCIDQICISEPEAG